MSRDDRARYDAALRRARAAAYPPGEFVGQESFMQAREILALAARAGVGPGVSVLDLCCGVAGPGRLLAERTGCTYLGVDASRDAVELARARGAGLPFGFEGRFEVAEVPPVPDGPFDVVLLLETLLAFADKEALLEAVAAALTPGGRFAFTVEEGRPLTEAERNAMPAADTVHPVLLPDLLGALARAGLEVRWSEECTSAHRAVAGALARAFLADRAAITAALGEQAFRDLLKAHRLWSAWLATGRVRKLAVVAVRTGGSGRRR